MGLFPLRGKVQLLPTANSLDQHIMQMHCSALREALDALSSFAERVIPSIAQAPAASMWPVSGPLLITRNRWLLFCRGVLALLRLLGVATPATRSWPDADHLLAAAARARAACGPFAAPRWRLAPIGLRPPIVGRVMAAAASAAAAAAASSGGE